MPNVTIKKSHTVTSMTLLYHFTYEKVPAVKKSVDYMVQCIALHAHTTECDTIRQRHVRRTLRYVPLHLKHLR